jgi:iron complex transport system substrate-binding protein
MAAVPAPAVVARVALAAAVLAPLGVSSPTGAATLGSAAEARRIISIIPATTEMLFAMGAGDRLVAVGTYDHFPAEVERLPRVGALLDPDIERIITLRPDLVVLYGTQSDLRSQLDRASIAYYPYVHRGLPDVAETIRSLGARVGLEREANTLAARVERQIADVRARVANRPRPRTLLVFGREPGSLRDIDSSGGVGFLHDMLEAAGGSDVFGDVKQQNVATSTEMVLARAPEVIIELHYAQGRPRNVDLAAWGALPSVPAVRNHRVYVLQGGEFVIPGPRVGTATERLSRAILPEAW